MDITDVHDLNRCFPAGRWARCVCRFGRRKVNRILCDSRKIKEAKDCGAKENGGSRGYIHIAKIMRQYRAFASDRTLANVRVFCLLVINIGSFSRKDCLPQPEYRLGLSHPQSHHCQDGPEFVGQPTTTVRVSDGYISFRCRTYLTGSAGRSIFDIGQYLAYSASFHYSMGSASCKGGAEKAEPKESSDLHLDIGFRGLDIRRDRPYGVLYMATAPYIALQQLL
jgi:hypothetical protein